MRNCPLEHLWTRACRQHRPGFQAHLNAVFTGKAQSANATQSANGATYPSLGRRPRYTSLNVPRAESPVYHSAPYVPFVVRNLVPVEERSELSLKTPPLMVLALPINVPHQRWEVGRADREQAIPSLPCKIHDALPLHPHRRTCLELRNDARGNAIRRKSQRQMHMVRHTTGPVALAFEISRNGRHIRVQLRCHLFTDQRPAVPRAKHKMDQVEGQRLRHGRDYRTGFQPFLHGRAASLGLWPRLVSRRTFGPQVLGNG